MSNYLKKLEYYWKRRAIDRAFKDQFNRMTLGTFFHSFSNMKGALESAQCQYSSLAMIRYHDHEKLNARFQQYFDKPLTIKGASEIV